MQNAPEGALPPDVTAETFTDSQQTEQASQEEQQKEEPQDEKGEGLTLLDQGTSSLERLYRTQYDSGLSRDLTQFGYNLFSASLSSASKLAVPSDNYLIGPGDKLRIRIWGNDLDAAYTGTVGRDGSIDAPRIGIIDIAGTPFGQLDEIFRREAEKYVQGINISVSLVELRSIEIYVIGEVARPGLHLVPPFSTVLNGLMAGGGVNKSGSLRSIRLLRGDELQQEVDLYSLLLAGSRGSDVSLSDGDVLFVPRIGPTAAVAGAVAQPGIYELTSENNVADLLHIAGGTLPQSYIDRMYLRSYSENQDFVIQDIDKSAGADDLAAITVRNGDLLELQYLGASWPQTIRIQGNVWFPDVYNYRPGIKLSEIMTSPKLLKPESVLQFGLLHRYDQQTTEYQVEQFPLASLLAGQYDTVLNPYDRIEILSQGEFGKPIQLTKGVWRPEVVHLAGHVWFPDKYPYQPGLKLSEILVDRGMLKPDSILDFGLLHRYDRATTRSTVERFPLTQLFAGTYDATLHPYDRIEILSRESFNIQEPIMISGAVWKGGEYPFQPGLTLADFCGLAGGFRFDADQQRIDLSRQVISQGRAETVNHTLSFAQDGAFVLQPYDSITIRSVKDAASFKSVSISGEVAYPGTYRIRDGERLSDLIERAGNFTDKAYFYGASFISEQARDIQQASINRMIDDLEIRVQTTTTAQSQTAVDAADLEQAGNQQQSLNNLINRLRQIKATGRISLAIGPLESIRGSVFDVVLQPGDSLRIPQRPNFVSVVGSVYSPNSFLYQQEMAADEYLAKAGGPTKTADDGAIYVLKANGEILSTAQFSSQLFSSLGGYQPMPGDTIVVPEDLERLPYMRFTAQLTDIIFKIATTTGIIFAI